jgi:NAD(P)-dependent dehydrogenase (short-subunit alcohol dehydrogenase family)
VDVRVDQARPSWAARDDTLTMTPPRPPRAVDITADRATGIHRPPAPPRPVITFLASPAAFYITGTTVDVGGGR